MMDLFINRHSLLFQSGKIDCMDIFRGMPTNQHSIITQSIMVIKSVREERIRDRIHLRIILSNLNVMTRVRELISVQSVIRLCTQVYKKSYRVTRRFCSMIFSKLRCIVIIK